MNYRSAVSAFIINDKKEFIFVKGVSNRSYWKIPAGGVERDEDLKQALLREINEELGILESDLEVLAKSKHTEKFDWPKELSEEKFEKKGIWYDGQERTIFICKLKNQDIKLKLQEEEISEFLWVNKDNYEKYITIENQLETMKKVIEEFKKYF